MDVALLDLNNDEKEKEYHDLRKKLYTLKSMKKNMKRIVIFSFQSIQLKELENIGFKNVKLFDNPCKNYFTSIQI